MALLEVERLQTHFGTPDGVVRAVEGVSLQIAAGETLGVVGEFGCGKSVTAMSILRLIQEPPGKIAGSIRFEGRDLLELSEAEMRAIRGNAISMIFQEPMTSLNPVLTVGRQIGETLRLHQGMGAHQAEQKAIEMLILVGIPAPERRVREYPHQLSGGMRQRVMIAMALACNPKLLIADEPTTALDVTIQAQILDLMRDLQQRLGSAIMLITHDLGVVAEMAERVVVMYAGRKVEEAAVGEIFARPLHPYTQRAAGRGAEAGVLAARRRADAAGGDPRAGAVVAASRSSAARLPGAASGRPTCAGWWRRRSRRRRVRTWWRATMPSGGWRHERRAAPAGGQRPQEAFSDPRRAAGAGNRAGACGGRRQLQHRARRDAVAGGRVRAAASPPSARRSCG